MKGFLARLQKTVLFLCAATIVAAIIYAAVIYNNGRKNRASVQKELDAATAEVAKHKAQIGKNLAQSKDGKPPFDPSKYLHDKTLAYADCLASVIGGYWESDECENTILPKTDRLTGPWVTYAIPEVRSADARLPSAIGAAAIALLLGLLTLFSSWLFFGQVWLRP